MSNIRCPHCGSREHIQGYGFAAGVLGTYTMCMKCSSVLELHADTEGLTEEEAAAQETAARRIVAGAGEP